jgi:hypothetical protein
LPIPAILRSNPRHPRPVAPDSTANDNLRQALQHAGIQPDELAEIVQVDIRTVRRWLSGGVPYPRHRGKLARALHTTEQALWPHLTATTSTAAEAGSPTVTADVIVGYAHGDDIAAPTTEALIAGASERIELLDTNLYRLLSRPGIPQLLAEKARSGCQVRILLVEPGPYLVALFGVPGVEVRGLDGPERQTIHRADEQILLGLSLIGEIDPPPPLLHLHRQGPDGIFDRLAGYYDYLFVHAGDPIETEQDIDAYLADDQYDSEPEDAEDGPEAHSGPATGRASEPVSPSPAQTARRWPRRPT